MNNTNRMLHYYYSEMDGFRSTDRTEVEEWRSKGVYVFNITLSQENRVASIHFNDECYRLGFYQTGLNRSIMEELYNHMNKMDDLTALEMSKILLEGGSICIAYDYDDGLGYYD